MRQVVLLDGAQRFCRGCVTGDDDQRAAQPEQFFYGLQQRRGAPGPPYNRGSLLGELYPGTEKGAFSKEKTPEFAGAGDGI